MEWLVDNWSLLVVLVCAIGGAVFGCKKFVQSGKTNQIKKVKEWLLFACVEAERDFGSGKGQLKLRYVYDMFVEKFGVIKYIVTFEEFSVLVDDVLDSAIEFFENQFEFFDSVFYLCYPFCYPTVLFCTFSIA